MIDIPRTEDWCRYCRIMIPCITGQQPDEISTKNDIERVGVPGGWELAESRIAVGLRWVRGDWGWDISPTRRSG